MSPSTCVMLQSADVLREIAPVRADVAERRRGAALLGVEPPGVVGLVEQPVLEVVAVQKARRADVAARDRLPRVLDERIAAIVERDGGDDAGAPRLVDEPLRLGRRHGQRLVRDDVLPFRERRRRDLVVQIVRRGVVDDLHIGIVDQRLVAAVSLARAERFRLLPPGLRRCCRRRRRCRQSRAA